MMWTSRTEGQAGRTEDRQAGQKERQAAQKDRWAGQRTGMQDRGQAGGQAER